MTSVTQEENFPLTGPAMDAAYELRRRGLATGDGEQIAKLIDELTTLPQLIETLMDFSAGARVETDTVAFRQYVLDQASAALQRAGFEFSYISDSSANLAATRDLLRRGRQ
jgi:hypothetical protein